MIVAKKYEQKNEISKMKNILDVLARRRILLADGAWGTMLQEAGLVPGDCPEEWNLTNPDKIRNIASQYVEAGSQIILTNTFGGSSFKLSNYNLQDKVREINYTGVKLSRDVVGENAYVFSSVGPTGKFLEPLGEVSEDEMYEVFRQQIVAQEEGGADVILIETMSDLKEAKIAARAAIENTRIPTAVTMTFEKGQAGFRTMMGVTIESAVRELDDLGVALIGTNCGNGIEQIVSIVEEMRGYTDKYIIAQPNAGMPTLVNGRTQFEQSPAEMASHVRQLIEAGANVIGGCCGTTPDHIKEISAIMKQDDE